MAFTYVGLDGEMSGTEIQDGARLIQIGLALENGANYNAFINPGELSWSYEAEEVHGISQDRLPSFANAEQVDANAYSFLISQGAVPNKRINTVPVGWNVGSFDMPFLKLTLPMTYSLFSRRTVDLNAICFALDGKQGRTAKSWKDYSKIYATEKIGYEDAHDAGWDAKMSLYCFEFLRKAINNEITN